MSHDLYASWATTELARVFSNTPEQCFRDNMHQGQFSIFANRESGRNWPIPDGRLSIDIGNNRYEIAIEFKRSNEGLHGILTAIGQSEAYIHPSKGYSASLIVIPDKYNSYNAPGEYTRNVLSHINNNLPIGVFTYTPPDISVASPFNGKLICHRTVGLDLTKPMTQANPLSKQKSNTQWAHVREGSTESHAFFIYLQTAKKLTLSNLSEPSPRVPIELIRAVNRLDPNNTPLKYLSYSVGDTLHDVAWRNFWFNYILTDNVIQPWKTKSGRYHIHDVPTLLIKPDGINPKKFFSGRVDSIKEILVNDLNFGKIDLNSAWEKFAKKVRNRAHSYREDIDSGLEHLGFIESDGKPSDLGYRYVDVCERTGNCFQGTPRLILGAAVLKNGGFGALLHYFYKLSEERLKDDPLAFTTQTEKGIEFKKDDYLYWIRNELANNLNVMNTASIRGGVSRKPFQGELTILRKFGFVEGFRVGLGLEINWPLVQEYLEFII